MRSGKPHLSFRGEKFRGGQCILVAYVTARVSQCCVARLWDNVKIWLKIWFETTKMKGTV